LGENATLELHIDAKPETVLDLGSLHYSIPVHLQKYLARVDLAEVKPPIAEGAYRLTLFDSQKKKLVERSEFLGGVKNDSYQLSLKKYHDSILDQAKQELTKEEQLLNIWDGALLVPKDPAKTGSFVSETAKLQPAINGKYFYPQIASAIQSAAKSFGDAAGLAANLPALQASAQATRKLLVQAQAASQKPDFLPIQEVIAPSP
jgi:hypothetical protein